MTSCDLDFLSNFCEAACGYAGIDYATFRRWMERGEREARGAFRELYEAVQLGECAWRTSPWRRV